MLKAPLPRFLRPRESSQQTHVPVPVHAVYTHRRPFGEAQVLLWPCGTPNNTVIPRTVLLFIPGNPGLLDFYVPFLNAIYHDATSGSSGLSDGAALVIYAHAHLGLSSYVGADRSYPETSAVTLPAQVQAHLEFLDELLAAYGPATRVLLVGHSIGCWLIQEVLKVRDALRPRVDVYMLFPTISHIGKTPNGMKLSPLFRPPWPRTLAYLSLLVRHVPLRVLGLAQPSWPKNQLQVLRGLLQAPAAIYAALTMAHDEMQRVRELDVDFLRAFAERLWVCYAEEDGWVGGQREEVLCALSGMLAEGRVVHSRRGVPHAFCINHSAEVASQCVKWMRAGGLLG